MMNDDSVAAAAIRSQPKLLWRCDGRRFDKVNDCAAVMMVTNQNNTKNKKKQEECDDGEMLI
jgi:hypothetical protein